MEDNQQSPNGDVADRPESPVQEESQHTTTTMGAVDRPVPAVGGNAENETTPTPEGNGDQILITPPFTTPKLIEEQNKDSTLKQLFDATRETLDGVHSQEWNFICYQFGAWITGEPPQDCSPPITETT